MKNLIYLVYLFIVVSCSEQEAMQPVQKQINLRDTLPVNNILTYPVKPISNYYDANPFGNKTRHGIHLGADINKHGTSNCDLGDTLYAIGNGIVVESTYALISILYKVKFNKGKFYTYIISTYYHCDTSFVNINDYVKINQPVGLLGKKVTYTAHLHWEILTDTTKRYGFYKDKYNDEKSCIDPIKYIEEY